MRHPQIVRTTLRTVEDACPYRGLDDFHSFVRRRKVVRTTLRWEQAPALPRFVRERLFVRRRKIVRTTLRTVEDACPYRVLDDFHSFVRRRKIVRTTLRREQAPALPRFVRECLFVRRRKIVRTRMRTPHPSAFGCHLPPLGKAFGKCEHRLKP